MEPVPMCVGCQREPDEIEEYVEMADVEDTTPIEFVRSDEGTYNRENGHFWCTSCYIKAGQPLGVAA
jgi:hypothetical protein